MTEDDGPKPFRAEEDEKSLTDVFTVASSKWKSFHLDKIQSYGEKLLQLYEDLDDGNYGLTLANVSMEVLNDLNEDFQSSRPSFRDVSSPAWDRFDGIIEGGGKILSDTLFSLLRVYFEKHFSKVYVTDKQESGDDDDDDDTPVSNTDHLIKYVTDQGYEVFYVRSGYDNSDLYCKEEAQAESIRSEIADLIWDEHEGHLNLQYQDQKDQIKFEGKQSLPWDYQGKQGEELISRWKAFKREGIRRSVILHGKPGTGKSTLAQYASKELEGRVLFMATDIMSQKFVGFWPPLLRILSPDILIIDDLDRLSQRYLEQFLRFFEETENPVPFILATTNHLDRLPDAIKRPGRFDEIWKISEPSGDVKQRVIHYLAELEDYEPTEAEVQRISEISEEQDLPGAHIRELIRRVKAVGPEELEFEENDLTFDDEWNELDEDVPTGNTTLEDFEETTENLNTLSIQEG